MSHQVRRKFDTTGRGQPLTLNDEGLQERIIRAIQSGNFVGTACRLAGIGHSTFYEWRERARDGQEPYQTFFEQVEKASAEAEAAYLSRIALAAQQGEWTAAAWFLERAHHKRWGRKVAPAEALETPDGSQTATGRSIRVVVIREDPPDALPPAPEPEASSE